MQKRTHALILCGRVEFSTRIRGAACGERGFSKKLNKCVLFNNSSAKLGKKMLKCRD
jgi:hypothetical protein